MKKVYVVLEFDEISSEIIDIYENKEDAEKRCIENNKKKKLSNMYYSFEEYILK